MNDIIELDAKHLQVKAIVSVFIDELSLAMPSSKWLNHALIIKNNNGSIDELIPILKSDVDNNHQRKEMVENFKKVNDYIYHSSRLIINQQKKIQDLENTINSIT